MKTKEQDCGWDAEHESHPHPGMANTTCPGLAYNNPGRSEVIAAHQKCGKQIHELTEALKIAIGTPDWKRYPAILDLCRETLATYGKQRRKRSA